LATSPISLSWRAKVAEGRLNYFGIFTEKPIIKEAQNNREKTMLEARKVTAAYKFILNSRLG
jgi:hypothetical protein